MSDQINIGSLIADLDINTTPLQKGLKDADSALQAIKKQIADTHAAFKAGQMGVTDYTDRLAYLSEAQNDLAGAMTAATDATATFTRVVGLGGKGAGQFGNSVNTAQKQANQFGMGLMQVGYMVDDLQYGFKSIINNIGPFTYSMSVAAGATNATAMGVAASVQTLIVVGYQLATHWGTLMDSIGLGKVKTEAEEMEELAKKTNKTAEETERLNKAKKDGKEIDAMLEERTPEQEKREKDTKAVIAAFGDDKNGTGGEKIVDGLARVIQKERPGIQPNAEEQKKLDALEDIIKEFGPNAKTAELTEEQEKQHKKNAWFAGLGGGISFDANPGESLTAAQALEEQKNKIKARMNTDDREEAKKQMLDMTKDPEALKAGMAKVKRNPGAFPEGTYEKLRGQTPEFRNTNEELGKAEAEFYKNLAVVEKEKKEREKDHDDRVKEMVKNFLSGPEKAQTLKEGFDRDSVEQQMIRGGVQPEEAHALTKDVTRKLGEETEKKIEDYALKNGMTYDEAKQAMIGEAQDKFTDQATAKARKIAPKIDHQTDEAVAAAKMSGDPRSMGMVQAEIEATLKRLDAQDNKKDLTDEQVTAAAESILKKSNANVDSKINDEAMKEPAKEKINKVQQFDMRSLADKVQGGVGGEQQEQKKQTGYLARMTELLAERARAGGAIITIK